MNCSVYYKNTHKNIAVYYIDCSAYHGNRTNVKISYLIFFLFLFYRFLYSRFSETQAISRPPRDNLEEILTQTFQAFGEIFFNNLHIH